MSVKKYSVKVNGTVYDVEVEELSADSSSSIISSAPSSAITAAPPPATSGNPAASGTQVLAPLNGTILSVAVKLGDKIKKGSLLSILEAMKMENEVFAPKDGIISAVNVSKGSSVGAGDVLFLIQ